MILRGRNIVYVFIFSFIFILYTQFALWRQYPAEKGFDTANWDERRYLDAISYQPLNMHYRLKLASFYIYLGKAGPAEGQFLKAVKLDRTNSVVHYDLANFYASELGGSRLDLAAEYYKKAMSFSPEGFQPDILDNAYKNFKGDYGRLRNIVKQTDVANHMFAGFLRDKKRYKESVREFKKSVILADKNKNRYIKADSTNWIAIIYGWQGDISGAIKYFERAIDLAEDNSYKGWIYRNMGNTYLNSGDFKKAESACKKSIESDPSAAANYYTLGNVYDKIGLPRQARDCYYTALKFTNDRYLLEQISKKLKEINS